VGLDLGRSRRRHRSSRCSRCSGISRSCARLCSSATRSSPSSTRACSKMARAICPMLVMLLWRRCIRVPLCFVVARGGEGRGREGAQAHDAAFRGGRGKQQAPPVLAGRVPGRLKRREGEREGGGGGGGGGGPRASDELGSISSPLRGKDGHDFSLRAFALSRERA
jgi:hypothetical protein